MRSSVSYMLSHGSGEPTMSHPDYEQHAHHHGSLLVLVRGIGSSKPRSLQTIFERLQKVNNVKISGKQYTISFPPSFQFKNHYLPLADANGHQRDIWVRFVQEHPVENNDWGDFQTHRRLLGLITVGKFDTQSELNELCRVHESLKVKYTNTLFDSRCLLFGGKKRAASQTPSIPTDSLNSYDSSNSASTDGGHTLNSISSLGTTNSNAEDSLNSDDSSIQKLKGTFSKPSVLQSQAFFYPENDACLDLEANIVEFVNSLFWILESKRLKKSQEKIDKVVLLQAPFEKKDFVGLDLDTRNNRKRCMGRVTKHLADLTLQAGLVAESLTLYHSASDTLRAISDSLWLGAASEGLCAASAILLYPNCQSPSSLQRNASLPNDGTTATNNRSLDNGKRPLPNASGVEPNDAVLSPINSASSSNSSVSSMLLSSSSSGGTLSANDPPNILPPDEIVARYRDAIINYSKYRHAGIIETEAALKAARICIEQNRNIDVSMFLQNVLYINLTMSEQERVHRFETLTQLYQDIGYKRKAAFCQRLAAWRHVAQSNSNPDWGQSYKLMLDSFGGHRLAMDPMEVLQNNAGWPCLQVDLVQQLVAAARRLGQSALATRHMTFMLQTMWRHLTAVEQREMALQLQSLSAQCEGAPVPLVLETGTVIPPANLTDLPRCEMFVVKELPSHLRPFKLVEPKASGPSHFLYTPLHFNQHSIDRRQTKKDYSKIGKKYLFYIIYFKSLNLFSAFQWIQNDLCEVTVRLKNPLPFELHVSDMRLLTNGVVFESLPQTVILAPAQPTLVTLHGTPIEHGSLEIQGYSTHALGVKSNCRLKAMIDRTFPPNYLVDVIPALPTLQLATSLPQTATFTGMPNADSVIVSASATIFNGESTDCVITLTNNSAVPITHLEESLQSTLDVKLQKLIFTWSPEELQSKLPIAPQTSVDFTVTIYAEADFLGPVIGIGSPYPPHPMSNDGPSSLNTHYASGNASLPSRVSSPVNMIQRRTEVSSSFRSTHSGHSSLATISLGAAAAGCSTVRHLDVQFRFRYSGGGGQQEGYCRQCAISFNLEFMPSAQVTNWDVLPAEM